MFSICCAARNDGWDFYRPAHQRLMKRGPNGDPIYFGSSIVYILYLYINLFYDIFLFLYGYYYYCMLYNIYIYFYAILYFSYAT